MATVIKQSYWKNVPALTEDSLEVIIPNGETWEVDSWVGSANPYRDTHVCLIWGYEQAGEEIIALTYTSLKSEITKQFVGNGTKKLAIVLRNDSLSSERLGAEFIYRKFTS